MMPSIVRMNDLLVSNEIIPKDFEFEKGIIMHLIG